MRRSLHLRTRANRCLPNAPPVGEADNPHPLSRARAAGNRALHPLCGTGHNKSAAPPPTHDKALRPDNRKSDMKGRFDLFRAPCPSSPQRWAKRLSAACGKCFRRWRPMFAYARLRRSQLTAAPTVSAITAPRAPSGFSWPTVESRAVWCSTSELSSAPTSTTMVESHIHIIRPTTAPSAP
jgi:hypothetical protein